MHGPVRDGAPVPRVQRRMPVGGSEWSASVGHADGSEQTLTIPKPPDAREATRRERRDLEDG